MIRLTQTATTQLGREDAFRNIGDFANIDRWDPGVMSSTQLGPGKAAVGTVYDLVLDYGGRRLDMQYRITELVPGRRVILEGKGARVKATDVIEFAEHDDGTLVTYIADLSLTGLARLFEPLMKQRFAKIGRDAGKGLRRWLSELEDPALATD